MSVGRFRPDRDGFFGIRFESIGGLGAHLAGQMLAEAGVLRQGLNGSHFSSYGSEKKGTPVKSFVRFAAPDREIRTSSPVETPQVVVIFHEAFGRSPAAIAGLAPSGTVIVNTTLHGGGAARRAPARLRARSASSTRSGSRSRRRRA